MIQFMPSKSDYDILHDSCSLLETLEQNRTALPDSDEVIARHRALHRELELHHHLSEQTLVAWRGALTRRWELEIAGQRLYKRIQRQLLDHFGADSPQLQAIAPTRDSQGITPIDLLADLRRSHASLRLLSSLPFDLDGSVAQLEAVCSGLADAIAMTHDLQQKRRNAMIDQRLALDIYQRVRQETQFLLSQHLSECVWRNGQTGEQSEYTGLISTR